MKKIFIFLSVIFISQLTKAQSDNCSGAVSLAIGSCVTGNPGATQNLIGCGGGNANDDAWYKFTATAGASYSITVKGAATYDAVFQIYSGTCAALTSIAGCVDSYANGGTESTILTNLAAGTYYIRIYDYSSSTTPGTFTTCITLPPPAPSNDNCTSPIALTVNSSCVNTAATSFAATQSTNVATNCNAGTPDDDVWFSFTATNYTQTIQVAPTGSMLMDPVIELFSGSCGTLTQLDCVDATNYGSSETMSAVGLVPGNTYYVRVYDWFSDGGYPFNICVSGSTISAGTQPNDNPCSAISLPAVTADCNYLDFSIVGATQTSTVLAPAPSGCENWNGSATAGTATPSYTTPTTGGFTTTSKDVWFSITVPANGSLYIMPRPNMGAGWVQDGVMALYRGANCSALTQYTCSDDHDYPAGYNDFQPFIQATGLTPGEVVYLRYFGYGSSSGSFGLCVTAPTNDICANALYICDLNGYSAMTSEAYKRDWPCNMKGDAETTWNAALQEYNYSAGSTPSGGPFGLGGVWGVGQPTNAAAPYYDVQIDKNSWVRFTAASATASFRVKVYDCWGAGSNTLTGSVAPPKGVQMQIFSATNCCSFTPVSDFKENTPGSFVSGVSTYTLNANSLTVGNDYYLMIDGWGGDICKYDIQALTGVALPDIVANPPSVCPGQSSILTAPAGATSYTWEPGGANTQTISVTPGSTETYTCYVGGVCGNKQMLTKTVTMKVVPLPAINSGTAITTCGQQTITLSASGASTYTWNTSSTATSFTANPSSNTTYSLIATAANGCTNTASSTVTVNAVPTITLTSSNTNTICYGQSTVLTATGTATSYTWSPGGAATSITVSPLGTTVYNVTGINAQGCTKVTTMTLNVNPLPSVSASSITICNTKTGTLTANGASTYTWSTGSTASTTTVNPSTTTSYTVVGTSTLNCNNSAVVQVSVNPTPTVSINSGSAIAICNTQTITLTGGGATTYTWNTGSTSSNISISPSVTTSYSVIGSTNGCTNTSISNVTVNALPSITASGTNTICPGVFTTLSGSNGVTYTWTPGSTVSQTISVSPASNTTYTVTGTDANGCKNTAVRTVSVNATPTISVNSQTICNGTSALLTATSSATSYSWNTGSTSTSITPSPTSNTNYTVIGTAANTCTNSAIAQVTVVALPNVTAASGTICLNKTYTLTGTGANTYTWSTGQNGTSISVTPTTTTVYTVSGTAVSTCSNVNTVTVTVNLLPQVTTTPTIAQSNCATPTGSITGIIASGTPSLSPVWTTTAGVISTSWNLTNIPAQTYNLQITDGNGCINNYAYTVTNPGAPAAPTVSVASNPVCTGGTINLFANGTSGVTYNWSSSTGFSSSVQNPTITNVTSVQSGTYAVSTSSAGCTGAATSIVITVNPLPNPSAVASQSAYCEGNTIMLSGSSATTYTWSGPGSFSANTQTISITNASTTTAGIYTLSVTDGNGCSNSNTVNVTVNTNPVITATANPGFICVGQTINLTAGGGNSYTWNGPSSYTSAIQSPSITNASTLNAGTYTVVVTAANSCTSSAITTVSVNTLPTFTSAVNAANICYGNTIQFDAGSNTNTYSWEGPNSFSVTNNASPNISNATPLNSGTYTVTAGGGSCSASQTIAVNVYPQISLSAAATSTSICDGDNLQLLGTGGTTYTWTGPGSYTSNNQNPIITGANTSATGTYTYAITDVNNCSTSTTLAVMINANPTATAAANPSAICDGETINLTAGGGTSYSWSGPNGYNSSSQTSTIPNAGSVYSGEYTVTVTDANNCSSTTFTTVIVNTLPSYTCAPNAGNVCYGSSIQLDASSSALTYTWTGPNSYSANGSSQTINNVTTANSGIYTVTASDGNCAQSQTVSVSVYPQIVMNASASTNIVCDGNTIDLIGNGGDSYSWSGPNVYTSTNQNPQITNASSTASGIYTLTVTNATTNCTEMDTVLIAVAPTPSLVSSSNGSTCFGNTMTLSADFGSGVNVNWYSDATLTTLVQANSTTYQPNLNTQGTYVYYAQGTVGNCASPAQTITAQYTNINADAVADVYTGFTPLTVNFTNTSTGVDATDYFNWNFNDGTGSNTFDANHIFTNEGTYNVILIINETSSGCADTTSLQIKVEEDVVIIVPNVFTPNGDGSNDLFHVSIKGAKTAEGYIFNRWGQQLYSWDVINTSWDGKASNGEICPDATYYYLIKVIDKKDKEHLFPGYVLIIR